MDGNWKVNRTKCLAGTIVVDTKEYGQIETGCRNTPLRGSYYCALHSKEQEYFIYKGNVIATNPALIRPSTLCNFNSKILILKIILK